jgi:hypothetical protein
MPSRPDPLFNIGNSVAINHFQQPQPGQGAKPGFVGRCKRVAFEPK